ncbi:MAG: helix-turn-helix domain-containing protein [Treponemataceae bacterium]|nr:helix-turn-helix domain-containing protein [Treponemataceae bacterium]
MLSKCNIVTDDTKKELASHGTIQFPLACYSNDLREAEIPWHWHDEFEIIVCVSGKAIVNVAQNKITLKRNEAVFINSRAIHSLEKCFGEINSLVFNSKIISGTSESFFNHSLIFPFLRDGSFSFCKMRPTILWQKRCMNLAKIIWDKTKMERPEFQNDSRYLLTKIFYILIANCKLKNSAKEDNRFATIQNERVKKIILFIEKNYSSGITLERIADFAAVSKSVVLRDFKSVLKISPLQYVKKIRIEKSCQMLSSSDEKISSIASECGFNDMSYFSKSFKEQTGKTPEEYRKQI